MVDGKGEIRDLAAVGVNQRLSFETQSTECASPVAVHLKNFVKAVTADKGDEIANLNRVGLGWVAIAGIACGRAVVGIRR